MVSEEITNDTTFHTHQFSVSRSSCPFAVTRVAWVLVLKISFTLTFDDDIHSLSTLVVEGIR
jgi:hypothetical protein